MTMDAETEARLRATADVIAEMRPLRDACERALRALSAMPLADRARGTAVRNRIVDLNRAVQVFVSDARKAAGAMDNVS
jgi:hypothetical protein